jgi:predicted RNA-binding Zn-ribbon protein involved in translation (DUF1610 family)
MVNRSTFESQYICPKCDDKLIIKSEACDSDYKCRVCNSQLKKI